MRLHQFIMTKLVDSALALYGETMLSNKIVKKIKREFVAGISKVFIKAISSNINYYGVDPNPACTFYTQELIRLNSFKNAKLFTFALGESKEILSFYASRLGDGTGSLIKEHQSHNNMEYSFDTIVLTGDSLVNVLQLKEDISVIKIDVEEAELYVLRGLVICFARASTND